METPLKNCPFCGHNELIVFYDDGWDVDCPKCGAHGPETLGIDCDDKQLCIDRWNTRTPPIQNGG